MIMAGQVREAVRDAAKAAGIYEWIRNSKDRAYRSLRDSSWIIPLGIRHILGSHDARVQEFSVEFDKERLWEQIAETVARRSSAGGDFQPSTSSPFNLRALYILCRLLRPANVVETGVASGASSWTLLTALERNGSGKLHSIDLPPSQWDPEKKEYKELDQVSLPAGRQTGWLVPETLRRRWTLILGDTKRELPGLLEKIGPIGLFYHDAEHTREAMLFEFRSAWSHLAPGGALTSDDIGWNTAFAEFQKEARSLGSPKRWFSFGMIRKNGGLSTGPAT